MRIEAREQLQGPSSRRESQSTNHSGKNGPLKTPSYRHCRSVARINKQEGASGNVGVSLPRVAQLQEGNVYICLSLPVPMPR